MKHFETIMTGLTIGGIVVFTFILSITYSGNSDDRTDDLLLGFTILGLLVFASFHLPQKKDNRPTTNFKPLLFTVVNVPTLRECEELVRLLRAMGQRLRVRSIPRATKIIWRGEKTCIDVGEYFGSGTVEDYQERNFEVFTFKEYLDAKGLAEPNPTS